MPTDIPRQGFLLPEVVSNNMKSKFKTCLLFGNFCGFRKYWMFNFSCFISLNMCTKVTVLSHKCMCSNMPQCKQKIPILEPDNEDHISVEVCVANGLVNGI